MGISDRFKPNGSDTWRIDAIKKKISILNSNNKYIYWLIPKFTSVVKGARVTPEQLAKMIIRDGITSQEKEVLIEMLYN